jgi:hypothetical protein
MAGSLASNRFFTSPRGHRQLCQWLAYALPDAIHQKPSAIVVPIRIMHVLDAANISGAHGIGHRPRVRARSAQL